MSGVTQNYPCEVGFRNSNIDIMHVLTLKKVLLEKKDLSLKKIYQYHLMKTENIELSGYNSLSIQWTPGSQIYRSNKKIILRQTRQVYNGPRVVKFISAKRKKILVKNDF